ncbi:MAG: UvrB/UvrC motif-containing protein [Brevinema sp.]
MKEEMIKIEFITVLNEAMQYLVLFESKCGSYECYIDSWLAKKIDFILRNLDQSVLNSVISSFNVSDRQCFVKKDKNNIVCELLLNQKKYISSLEEILPIALELQANIFMDQEFFQNDYIYNESHEKEVQEMLVSAEYYFQQSKIKELHKEIEDAVHKEQYEYAALLRDKIQLLEQDKNN